MTDIKLTAELLDELEARLARWIATGDETISYAECLRRRKEYEGAIIAAGPSLISAARASLESRAPAVWVVTDEDGDLVGAHSAYSYAFAACTVNDYIQGYAPVTAKTLADVSKEPAPSASGAESMAGWVRADERRPGDNQRVLVCNSYGEARVGSYDSPTGDVLFRDGFWHLCQCTHWRPAPSLPSPPEPTNGR